MKLIRKIWDLMNSSTFIWWMKVLFSYGLWHFFLRGLFSNFYLLAGTIAFFAVIDLQWKTLMLEDKIRQLEWTVNKPARERKEEREDAKKLILPHDLS